MSSANIDSKVSPKSSEWDIIFEAREGKALGKCPICNHYDIAGKRCEWCMKSLGVPLGVCHCLDSGPLGKICGLCGCEFKELIFYGTCWGCQEQGKIGDVCKDCTNKRCIYE